MDKRIILYDDNFDSYVNKLNKIKFESNKLNNGIKKLIEYYYRFDRENFCKSSRRNVGQLIQINDYIKNGNALIYRLNEENKNVNGG